MLARLQAVVLFMWPVCGVIASNRKLLKAVLIQTTNSLAASQLCPLRWYNLSSLWSSSGY